MNFNLKVAAIMKKTLLSLLLIAGVVGFSQSLSAQQTPEQKKQADIKRFQTTANTAKASLDKAEKKVSDADSLTKVGPQMITEGKAELKDIEKERKAKDKEYDKAVKELTKKQKSKDKSEVTEAKAELKKVDTQYKADMKALDKKEKDATKKITTGESNKEKGKNAKKSAAEGLKKAQASYDAAQEKLDAANGVEKQSSKKDKKKKK
jgi:chromosome segregation ATPase